LWDCWLCRCRSLPCWRSACQPSKRTRTRRRQQLCFWSPWKPPRLLLRHLAPIAVYATAACDGRHRFCEYGRATLTSNLGRKTVATCDVRHRRRPAFEVAFKCLEIGHSSHTYGHSETRNFLLGCRQPANRGCPP